MAKTARRSHNMHGECSSNDEDEPHSCLDWCWSAHGKKFEKEAQKKHGNDDDRRSNAKIFGNSLWKLSFWSDFFSRCCRCCVCCLYIARSVTMEACGCCVVSFFCYGYLSRVSIFHVKPEAFFIIVQRTTVFSDLAKKKQSIEWGRRACKYFRRKKPKKKRPKYDGPRGQMLEEKLNFRLLIVLHSAIAICRLIRETGVALHFDYLLIYFNLCGLVEFSVRSADAHSARDDDVLFVSHFMHWLDHWHFSDGIRVAVAGLALWMLQIFIRLFPFFLAALISFWRKYSLSTCQMWSRRG